MKGLPSTTEESKWQNRHNIILMLKRKRKEIKDKLHANEMKSKKEKKKKDKKMLMEAQVCRKRQK